MLIAHLSDPHITTGALAAEPATGLHRALGRTLTLDPRPDCVVITGDLVDHGGAAEYAVLHELIAGFPLPLHLVAGNHDGRAALLDRFGGTSFLGGASLAHYSIDYPEVTIVVLDSLVPGSDTGHLGAEQLHWLGEVLDRRPEVPAMVALHHPPRPVGLPFMDSIGLADGADLAALLSRYPNVIRVLAGHLHRVVFAPFAGTLLTVAPSTYRQTALAMRADAPLGYLHEPTGFLLHVLSGNDCVTHSVPVSHAAALTGAF